jgi:hypothetical protein
MMKIGRDKDERKENDTQSTQGEGKGFSVPLLGSTTLFNNKPVSYAKF